MRLPKAKETTDNLSYVSTNSDHVTENGAENSGRNNSILSAKKKSLTLPAGSGAKSTGKKSMFYVLLNTTKFKNENIYYNIVIKEKVGIILWIFICMYLLSFLLWIRGDPAETKHLLTTTVANHLRTSRRLSTGKTRSSLKTT
jgi:hypothetical protein